MKIHYNARNQDSQTICNVRENPGEISISCRAGEAELKKRGLVYPLCLDVEPLAYLKRGRKAAQEGTVLISDMTRALLPLQLPICSERSQLPENSGQKKGPGSGAHCPGKCPPK